VQSIMIYYLNRLWESFVFYRCIRLLKYLKTMRFEVLTEVNMKVTIFWDLTPCSCIERSKRFRVIRFLHVHGDMFLWKARAPPPGYTPEHPRRLRPERQLKYPIPPSAAVSRTKKQNRDTNFNGYHLFIVSLTLQNSKFDVRCSGLGM
jgi:hypothetical protein